MDAEDKKRQELVREIGGLAQTLGRTYHRANMPHWIHLQLTFPQFKMAMLINQMEPASVSALAEALSIGDPTASHLIDKLCKRGLVKREEDPSDRRRALVALSDKGKKLVDKLIAPRNWIAENMTRMEVEDLEALKRGLAAMVAMIQGGPSGSDPCARRRTGPGA